MGETWFFSVGFADFLSQALFNLLPSNSVLQIVRSGLFWLPIRAGCQSLHSLLCKSRLGSDETSRIWGDAFVSHITRHGTHNCCGNLAWH